jgi:ABC-type branched-subunit amino acid transport system substrate-binding protein
MVAGKRIKLIVRDDASSADNGKRLIQEAIVNDKVDIVGGGLTADLLGSAALITEAKKPTVIMLSSTTSVIEKSPYFVRTSCTLAQSSAILADWAVQNGLKKAVTLVTDFSPGQEAETTFTNNFAAGAARSRKRFEFRYETRILLPSFSASGKRCRRCCSYSSPRSRPPPLPSSLWSADWTRPEAS